MNLNNIEIIEFESIEGEMVAIYNVTVVSEDEVRKYIPNYDWVPRNDIIICQKDQFRSVFGGSI